jgi:hypothetical protein
MHHALYLNYITFAKKNTLPMKRNVRGKKAQQATKNALIGTRVSCTDQQFSTPT